MYANITILTYANTLPLEFEISVNRYNSTKYKQSNNARANSVSREKKHTKMLNGRKLQQQHQKPTEN